MFLLAVVSFLLNLVALNHPEFLVMSMSFDIYDTPGLFFWLLIMITTDVGLAIGSKTSKRVVLIPCLVAYMIHIVITCIIAYGCIAYGCRVRRMGRGWEVMEMERDEKMVVAGFRILLPLFYIYTWIAARSLYIKLGQQETDNSLSFNI